MKCHFVGTSLIVLLFDFLCPPMESRHTNLVNAFAFLSISVSVCFSLSVSHFLSPSPLPPLQRYSSFVLFLFFFAFLPFFVVSFFSSEFQCFQFVSQLVHFFIFFVLALVITTLLLLFCSAPSTPPPLFSPTTGRGMVADGSLAGTLVLLVFLLLD